MITTLAVSGYRSLRDIALSLGRLTIISGANGSGKSSLYRSLRLLAEAAQGRMIASLAAEGGLASTLWAGPEALSARMRSGAVPIQGTQRTGPVALRLGFASDDYGYAVDLGLPIPSGSRFAHDPEFKVEAAWIGDRPTRGSLIAERRGPLVRLRRREDGAWQELLRTLAGTDSMMTHAAGSADGFELAQLRDRIRGWRFYDDLRADRAAPARRPQVGTFTPSLADDGSDLAAAVQTIVEIGDAEALDETIADAFPGAGLSVADPFELRMHQHGLLRPLRAAELSEGTLRYILLAAALLTPRPPELMVLNEPEAGLHVDLIAPLGRLLCRAVRDAQIVVISHSEGLIDALEGQEEARHIRLTKDHGETCVPPESRTDWTWPKR
ncbi:AAA family ATPase [Sphingomonas sp.]|jgi:predicted ATPase|uniref:AAA family ATPase n=1 Tax=Sphingomonas sp. TaxID=28214 RepID=UPI0035C814C2